MLRSAETRCHAQPRFAAAVLIRVGTMLEGDSVVRVEALGERLAALRLCEAGALARIQQSLSSLGQLSSIAVFAAAQGKLEVVDGFKRACGQRGRWAGAKRAPTRSRWMPPAPRSQ